MTGGGKRTAGMGLAGILPNEDVCVNQPRIPRYKAARSPKSNSSNNQRRRREDNSDSDSMSMSDTE